MKRILNIAKNKFLIWDTSFDAPITKILSKDDMIIKVNNYTRLNKELVENAERWGVSTQLVHSDKREDQIEELIYENRAGIDDIELTIDEIIENYSNEDFIKKKYRNFI